MQKVELVGSHLSVQTEMDVPFPTCQRYPCWTIFWAAIMLRQAYEGEEPRVAVRKSPSGKYLAFKTLCTREEVWVCKRHPCLAKRAKLNALKSRKPKPSSIFGVQILSQLIHAVLFFPLFYPHQNWRTILVISSHNEFGSRNTLIVYVRIA